MKVKPLIEMEKLVLFCIVVDDEPLAQRVLENYISRTSELTLISKCESAEEAFEVLRTKQVDVIFLDLDLKSMKGTDLIAKMKNSASGGQYYIIITSAALPQQLKPGEIFTSDDIVLIDYLRKPFSFDRFQEAVQKLFKLKQKKVNN
jgi:response regulator of citrate/malate metabolism